MRNFAGEALRREGRTFEDCITCNFFRAARGWLHTDTDHEIESSAATLAIIIEQPLPDATAVSTQAA